MEIRPRIARIALLALLVCGPGTYAESQDAPANSAELGILDAPAWTSGLDGYMGKVRARDLDSVTEVTVAFTYPNGERGIVTAVPTDDPDTFAFKIPPAPKSPPGVLTLSAEALYGMHGTDRLASETLSVPLSYREELDITGEAAIAYLYPLGGDAYTVRYVPCCNIYGGVTIAERVPVNPVETGEGLPEKLLSDFVVLEPDGLSASTMGMYFDFKLGPDAFNGVEEESIGLYEFDGKKWVEFQDYEVDRAAGRVSFHCPTGGEFVLVVKP